MKTPYQDGECKGGVKRTYWTRDMAIQARRAMRVETEAALARKGKKYAKTDRVKALDEKWGEYCETQRSIAEGQALLREHPGIDRQEHDFPRRKG
jgi:hypothetical protein